MLFLLSSPLQRLCGNFDLPSISAGNILALVNRESIGSKPKSFLNGFWGDANHMTEQRESLSYTISSRIKNNRLSLMKNNIQVYGFTLRENQARKRNIFNSAILEGVGLYISIRKDRNA